MAAEVDLSGFHFLLDRATAIVGWQKKVGEGEVHLGGSVRFGLNTGVGGDPNLQGDAVNAASAPAAGRCHARAAIRPKRSPTSSVGRGEPKAALIPATETPEPTRPPAGVCCPVRRR